MKLGTLSFILRSALLVGAVSLSCLINASCAQAAEALSLEDMVLAVKVAIAEAQTALANQADLQLEEVTLEVKAVQKSEADGGFSFWILEASAGRTQEASDSIVLVLTPPPPGEDVKVGTGDLSERLRKAIIAGVPAINEAAKGTPVLLTKSMTVKINFALTVGAGGKLGVEFLPFSAAVGGKVSQAAINSIIVKYKGQDTN